MRRMHPEKIKAEIRIRFGSMAKFEREQGLGRETARAVLQGKTVRRTAKAIAEALGVSVEVIRQPKPKKKSAHSRNYTSRNRDSHRLNEGAK